MIKNAYIPEIYTSSTLGIAFEKSENSMAQKFCRLELTLNK